MKKEKLIVLGTGNAMVTECYNTCFAIKKGPEYFMIDAGGGNGILKQLKKAGIDPLNIRSLFVTHGHTDHLLGTIWVIRQIASLILAGQYSGNFHIYCHADLVRAIAAICQITLQKKLTDLFGDRIVLIPVSDGQIEKILDARVTFFDIHSTKLKQYSFTMLLSDGQKLTCLGDEPYNPVCEAYVRGSDWLLCEAFCLYAEADRFRPYEKHHSTVKEASELAETLQVQNLVLWHTEETHLKKRKKLYKNEAKKFFRGRVYVPDDLDRIKLVRKPSEPLSDR